MLAMQRTKRPEHMRQNALPGGAAVGIGAGGVAAEGFQETMQLALGMVKTSGAGPAVRATKNRLVAAARLQRSQLAGQQVKRDLPAHLHERLCAPPLAGSRTIFQIAFSHRRTANTRIAGDRIGE